MLPDFDDMIDVANNIGNNKTLLALKEAELEQLLAEITNIVTDDVEFWVNKKPPSMAFIKSNYHLTGIDSEDNYPDYSKAILRTLRLEIAQLKGDLRRDELLFQVYRDMIGVWRTQSANERGTFLEQ